jgi:hypothetical protein
MNKDHEHAPLTSRDLPRNRKAPSLQVTVETCECGCERVKSVADEAPTEIHYSAWVSKRP